MRISDWSSDVCSSDLNILLAMVLGSGTPVGKAFADAGVKPDALNAAIAKLTGGRTADTPSAEDRYHPLQKSARPLTAAARECTPDPVLRRADDTRRLSHLLARRPTNHPTLLRPPRP